MIFDRAAQQAFFGVWALLFAASATVTPPSLTGRLPSSPHFVLYHVEFRG